MLPPALAPLLDGSNPYFSAGFGLGLLGVIAGFGMFAVAGFKKAVPLSEPKPPCSVMLVPR